jgi:hypothetical protein
MAIPTYTPGYPPDGSSLGQTKSTIRNNLDGTFETLAVDHVNNNGVPGSNPAGYHTIIHQVTQASVATVSGYNQVFSGVPGSLSVNSVTTPTIPPGGDTQLYSLSGAGVLSQLTGSIANENGYAWVGGFLLQWGYKNNVNNGDSISFTVDFPNNCFNVQVTTNGFGATVSGTNNHPFLKNEFNVTLNFGTNVAINWFAIGN